MTFGEFLGIAVSVCGVVGGVILVVVCSVRFVAFERKVDRKPMRMMEPTKSDPLFQAGVSMFVGEAGVAGAFVFGKVLASTIDPVWLLFSGYRLAAVTIGAVAAVLAFFTWRRTQKEKPLRSSA